MTYHPGGLRAQSREITNAINWGVRVITALVGLGLFVSEIRRIWGSGFNLMQYAYIALFLLTGCLIFLWIWATQKELDLLFDWLDPERYVPPSTIRETLMILFFAVTLSVLLFVASSPLLYGVVFTIYSIILIPASIYTNNQIRIAICNSKKRASKDLMDTNLSLKAKLYLEGIGVLEAYFLKRPAILRLATIFVASTISTIVAVLWKMTGSRIVGAVSYILFIVTIFISELVIAYWRCVRDDSLRSVQSELAECQRQSSDREPINH